MWMSALTKSKALNKYKVLLLHYSIFNICLYLTYMTFLKHIVTYAQTSIYSTSLQHNAFVIDCLQYWNNKNLHL